MQFSILAFTALMATFVAATPVADASPAGALLRRAIDYGKFTEAELANVDPEACCCCVPPSQITNVDVLHKLIDASE